MKNPLFQFKVKDQEYSGYLNQFKEISSHGILQSCDEFVIEKNGEYFITLGFGCRWSWIIKDKVPISIEENLVQQIGKAAHEAYFKLNN